MRLYCEVSGHGPDVVLIHGWALNLHVWDSIVDSLNQHYRVTRIDLPGHGRSPGLPVDEYTLENVTRQLNDVIAEQSIVLGWSLGGLVALQLSVTFPNRVKKLILTACSPQFVQTNDWPHAVETMIFSDFASQLKTDYKKTVQKFLTLQSMGSASVQQDVRLLRAKVFKNGELDITSLLGGLKLLQTTNLRPLLGDIHCPVQLINGERDTLIPILSAQAISEMIHETQVTVIPGASHAPFLSHPELFIDCLRQFIDEK